MAVTRRVSLELLRHGPAHNQLLSPLTQYLALCANHHSETMRVPYEHNEFLSRHGALMYQGELTGSEAKALKAKEARELQLQITAREMSDIFRGIPGLISELRAADDSANFIEFELVLSASELAMLPFELATAPNGFPGAGQPLSVQTNSPLCMTRRVRRVSNDTVQWPCKPHILFAEALPEHDQELVPAHLLALRKAVAPWVRWSSSPVPGEQFITFLPQVTVEELQQALKDNQFTHVHLLAHGAKFKEGIDDRFGLHLCDDANPKGQTISGSRLAALIASCENKSWHRPSVVSIASCNGANGGSVVGAGSSVAHHLHEAGIPLVVSSQFPLSFEGSVVLVQELFDGLLWGKDPRRLLHCVRRHLRSVVEGTHDWASLVTYTALPVNLEQQLQDVKLMQSRSSITAAFSFSDSHAGKWRLWYENYQDAWPIKPDFSSAAEVLESLEDEGVSTDPDSFQEVLSKLHVGKERLKEIIIDLQSDSAGLSDEARLVRQATVSGLLASTEKREAELRWIEILLRELNAFTDEVGADQQRCRLEERKEFWKHALEPAKEYYRQAFESNRMNTWAIVQWLVLSIVESLADVTRFGSELEKGEEPEDYDSDELKQLWTEWDDALQGVEPEWDLARALLRVEYQSTDPAIRCLAISNKMDLEVIGLLFDCREYCAKSLSDSDSSHPCPETVHEFFKTRKTNLEGLASELSSFQGADPWEIVSRRRQLNRYVSWFFFYDYEFLEFEGRYKRFPFDLIGLIKCLARVALDGLPEKNPPIDD